MFHVRCGGCLFYESVVVGGDEVGAEVEGGAEGEGREAGKRG